MAPPPEQQAETVRIVLPFKDLNSSRYVKQQLNRLSLKLKTPIQPVFVSHKLEQDLKVRECKPTIVNNQCVVYRFECPLCDARYIWAIHLAAFTSVLKVTKERHPLFTNTV